MAALVAALVAALAAALALALAAALVPALAEALAAAVAAAAVATTMPPGRLLDVSSRCSSRSAALRLVGWLWWGLPPRLLRVQPRRVQPRLPPSK